MPDEKETPKEPTALSGDDLKQATGGAPNIFTSLVEIKGDSTDEKHKDEIHIESL